jgi:hypothetical protein
MAGVTGKGGTKILGGTASHGEVRVINGAVLVKVAPRGTQRRGIGSAQLLDGIASHNEVRIIDGKVRVKIV